jgi:hypothetical protein
LAVKPVEPRALVNGTVGWVIGQEAVGRTGRLKNGAPISNQPTIVTIIFEKHGDKRLLVSHLLRSLPNSQTEATPAFRATAC